MFGAPSLVSCLILGACVINSSASAQGGIELLHKMQTALGGAKNIAAIRDYEEIQSATTFSRDGKPLGKVVKRTRWIRPNLLRLDQVGLGDTYVLYFDGTAGWEILPTRPPSDQKKIIGLAGGELEFARKYLRDLSFNVWLADRDPRYRIESPAAGVMRIADSEDPTHQLDITLESGTGLPVKESTLSLADPAHPVPSETRFEEWQTVNGIRFPHRTAVFRNGMRLVDITVERIELNNGLQRDGLSTKPTDLNPVLSSN